VPKPAHFAPHGEGNLLSGRVPINQTLACLCHLSKQHNRVRLSSLPVQVERRLRLVSPLNHCPPLGIPDFLSVSAALRERARNNVEVFERRDDFWWQHNAAFAAARLRARHQHALDGSARGVTAKSVLDEALRPLEERAGRETLASRRKSGLGSDVCEMPVEVALMRA
jgi:hypothetical protein